MKKYWKNGTKRMAVILGAVLLTAVWLAGAFSVKAAETVPSFDVSRFILPEEAKMLVVVEEMKEVPVRYMPMRKRMGAGNRGCRRWGLWDETA